MKLEKKISYQLASEKDIPQLVKLFNSHYTIKKNDDYFLWQYFKSPLPTVLVCAFYDKKIIGMFGLQKKLLSNNIKIGQIIDILIAPDFRKMGIFKKLSKEAFLLFKDIEIYCVFANLNGKSACEKSLNFKTIHKIDQLVFDYNIKNDKKNNQKYNIINNNLVKFKKSNQFRIWRYFNHPHYRYQKISFNKNTFAIVKVFDEPNTNQRLGDIVEIKFSSDKDIVNLFNKLLKHFKDNNINKITTWALPHTKQYDVLSSLNFKCIDSERYFCIKSNHKKYDFLKNQNTWSLEQADTEIY